MLRSDQKFEDLAEARRRRACAARRAASTSTRRGAVERAIITHGHSDHARPGHGAVLATPETIAIMQARLGPEAAGSFQALRYGEAIAIGGVDRARWCRPATSSAARRWCIEHRGLPRRRLRRLQAPPRSDRGALRAGALRPLRHRGDLRAAGVPPRARRARDRPAARLARAPSPSARISSAPMASARPSG